MPETGAVRFPGTLDPSAQEFRPGFPTQITFLRTPPLYYPYAPVPFYDGSMGFGPPRFYDPVVVPHQPPYVAMAQLPPPPPPPALQSAGPTRVLVLSSVSPDVRETTVRRELEAFGEVRGVEMGSVRDGIVTVHFYDLRAAERAVRALREQYQYMQQQDRVWNLFGAAVTVAGGDCSSGSSACFPLASAAREGLVGGRAVWAHFIVPASNAVPDGNNQGTIVVFNLNPGISSAALKEIFQQFGPVKELRETPLKKYQRFVEFYDVRDAAKALREMNGKEINGRRIVIEFSRPGGYSKKLYNYGNNAAASMKALPPINDKCVPPPLVARKFPGGRFQYPNIPPRVFSSQTESFARKTKPNGSCTGRNSLEAAPSLLLNGFGEKVGKNGETKRNGKTSQGCVSKKVQSPNNNNRAWKGNRPAKRLDARFLISEEAMNESSCRDSRTTVMIKNIPNKYSQKLLLNMLDNHCIHCNEQIEEGDGQPLSSYDFVYLPIDFNNKCNVGYGFVNMTSPEATWRLYKAFHDQHWEVFNSRKICEVTYARVQGLEALKEHFRNSKFPCEMEHYLPVVFCPPRDGKQVSEPQPIGGSRKQQQGRSSVEEEEEEGHSSSSGGGYDETDVDEGGGGVDDEVMGGLRLR